MKHADNSKNDGKDSERRIIVNIISFTFIITAIFSFLMIVNVVLDSQDKQRTANLNSNALIDYNVELKKQGIARTNGNGSQSCVGQCYRTDKK